MGLFGSRPQLPLLCDSGSISLEKSVQKEMNSFDTEDFRTSQRYGKWMSIPIQTPRFEASPPQVVDTPRTPRAIVLKVSSIHSIADIRIISVSVLSTFLANVFLTKPPEFQAVPIPMENNSRLRDFHSPEQTHCYAYAGGKDNSSHYPEYPGTSNNGESRSEVTKSIVLKAIKDLKCRNMR